MDRGSADQDTPMADDFADLDDLGARAQEPRSGQARPAVERG